MLYQGDNETRFSAYSLLLYLNDDFSGGHTTFLDASADGGKRSRNGATRVKASDGPRAAAAFAVVAACAAGAETAAAGTVVAAIEAKTTAVGTASGGGDCQELAAQRGSLVDAHVAVRYE